MARDLMRREGALSPMADRWDPFQMMRDLLRFDPFGDLDRRGRGSMLDAPFTPSFDVKETEDAYELTADMPGVNEDDLDVDLSGNRLTISGKREQEERHEEETYYAVERSYGSFTRSFTLPEDIDPEKCEASLENGVLKVRLHKSEERQPRRVRLFGKQKEEKRANGSASEASKTGGTEGKQGKQGGERRA